MCVCVWACMLSHVWLFTTPRTVAFQAPLSMGLPIQVSMCICMCVSVSVCVCACAQLCPILCDPMDCSLPGTSVHGTSQARILEWAAVSYSKGLNLSLLHLLHWQADSLPLSHQGIPKQCHLADSKVHVLFWEVRTLYQAGVFWWGHLETPQYQKCLQNKKDNTDPGRYVNKFHIPRAPGFFTMIMFTIIQATHQHATHHTPRMTQFNSVQSLSHVRLLGTPGLSGLPVHHQLPEFT